MTVDEGRCGGGRERFLSPARLPVPPRSRDCCASTYAVGRWRDTGVWASVAFPPLRAAFSPCPAGARGSRFPPHDDSGGQLGAPEGRRTVPTAPRGVVRGEGGRERRGASPREREVGARAVGRVEVTEALPSRWTVV